MVPPDGEGCCLQVLIKENGMDFQISKTKVHPAYSVAAFNNKWKFYRKTTFMPCSSHSEFNQSFLDYAALTIKDTEAFGRALSFIFGFHAHHIDDAAVEGLVNKANKLWTFYEGK